MKLDDAPWNLEKLLRGSQQFLWIALPWTGFTFVGFTPAGNWATSL
jgi:hypothetical protein